jgi:CHRD domain
LAKGGEMKMRRIGILVAALTLTFSVAGAAWADDGGRPLSTALTGAAEVPGPGDADATGTVSLALNPGEEEVCFDLSWAFIDGTVVAAHIHVGAAGVAGPVVVPLFSGAFAGTDSTSACVSADPDLLVDIIQHPQSYYVNVHSTVFPAGAIRGQLSK